MKTLFTLLAGALAATSVVAIAADRKADDAGSRRISAAVDRAIAEQGDIVTPADHRAIAAKCGLAADAAPRNTMFTNGGLHCPDGRIVNDAETRALSERIGARATAVATAAVSRPEVVAAIHAYADDAAIQALRQLREGKR